MHKKAWIVGVALCALARSAGATTIEPMTAEELVPISSFIGKVTIIRGERLLIEREGRRLNCGYKYLAEVEEALKGDETPKEFVSEESMELGSDYLVYLSSESTGAPVVVSTNGAMLDALTQERNDRASCAESFPLPRSPVLTSSKFETYLGHLSVEASEIEWWIESSMTFSRKYDEEIDSVYVGAETLRVERNGTTTTMEESDYLEKSMVLSEEEVAEYPQVLLLEGLMKWNDVKIVLGRLIKESEELD